MHTLKLIDKKHKRMNFVTNKNLGIRYIGIIKVGYGIKNVNVPKNNEIGVSIKKNFYSKPTIKLLGEILK